MSEQTEETVNTRFVQLINELKLNSSSFSKQIGVFPSVVGNITGGRKGKPSFELLEKIAIVFPQVNMDWLVRGEGSILKSGSSGNSHPDCWDLLRREEEQHNRLKADYAALKGSFSRVLHQNILLTNGVSPGDLHRHPGPSNTESSPE